jgi:N-acetylneuraminate epimerase
MTAALVIAAMLAGSEPGLGRWTQLASIPDQEGFAGPFAGVSNGVLLVAGGANFPDKKPWEGGEKVWHDGVYVLEKPDATWKTAGKLPRPLAYGVSVSDGQVVICIGGSDADRHYADVFRLQWKDGHLITTRLPSLPNPLATACGTLIGTTLYLAGGQEQPNSPHASRALWSIDLSAREPKWIELAACPGVGRILATAASCDGAFWLIGGVELVPDSDGKVQRRYLKDAYRYDLPYPIAAAPSPAPSDATGFSVLGGDDGTQVGVGPNEHRGFVQRILRYDVKTNSWAEAGTVAQACVTVPCTAWNGSWIVPGGEVRPGIRSTHVWTTTERRE